MKFRLITTTLAVLLLAGGIAAVAQKQPPFLSSGKTVEAGTAVRVQGAIPPHDLWFATTMPGDEVAFHLPPGFAMRIDGHFVPREGRVTEWLAPQKAGVASVVIEQPNGRTAQEITLFVLEPADRIRKGRLNGYRIGSFPANRPEGFIALDGPGDMDVPVSPHFTIGQFLCKQQPDHWPKYLLLTPDLITRLETVLAGLHETGRTEAETLFVMSGFRTPFYNTAINGAKRSRHMYGDAADVYIDHDPTDGMMDDLSGDGRVTKQDANWLYDFSASAISDRPEQPSGGLGAYRANAVHGPFVHIDGRGKAARWGR